MNEEDVQQKLVELSKRRGFFVPSNEVYGGTAGFYSFGPQGATLKQNIEDAWRDRFTFKEGNKEIEAPTVMPEPVFEASGHLEGFDDMIIDCPECETSSRADHIVEDNTEIEEAESIDVEEIERLFKEHELQCPNCGNNLAGEPVDDFNLMFETNIGPGSSNPGYLRPETAQGIFVEFNRWKEYARNQLPFGITQIGKAYRNEISPRKSLVRVREFTQAELELFIDPIEDHPNLEKVEDVEVTLYPVEEQEDEEGEEIQTSIGEAVEDEIISSKWVAYYLGVAKRWYKRIGIDMNRFRYRQHLEGERAHYASDCWDAETDISAPGAQPDWIEVTGFAYRGCYDLKKHQKHSGEDFTVFKEYNEPQTERKAVVDPDMGWLGPTYGDHASKIKRELEYMAEKEPEVFERNEELRIKVNGQKFNIPVEKTGFEIKEVEKNGERILPEIVEPSFGIDRIFYTVLAHNYDEDQIDGEERTVMRLEPEIAPVEVAVFPLMDKDGLGDRAEEIHTELREAGFSTTYDSSGAIGRRYRRQDEVGTPYCITVDHQTLEEQPETVTIRDRDSTEQKRVKVERLKEVIGELVEGEKSFSEL